MSVVATSEPGTTPEPLDARTKKIVEGYNVLAQRTQALRQRVFELESQTRDYARVITALNDIEGERTAYRMVGDTLVKQTVKDAAQSLVVTHKGLSDILENCMSDLRKAETELVDYQTKNKIKIVDQ